MSRHQRNKTVPVRRTVQERREESSSSILTFPEDLGDHGMMLVFHDYDYERARGGGFPEFTPNIGNVVALPIPSNIQDSYSINLQNMNQRIIGEMISNAARETAASEGVGSALTGVQSTISNNLPSGGTVAGAAGDVINSLIGREGGNNAAALSSQISFLMRRTLDATGTTSNIDAGLGTTVNPKAALSFEGVELKTHNFEWQLVPRSPAESDRIRRISNVLKRNSLPSYVDVAYGESEPLARAMFRYPSTVDIFFLGGIDEEYFIKYKTAMIQSVDFNYTPQGVSILKGGKPTAVNISISLTETMPHTAENYGGGNNEDIEIDAVGTENGED